ncbi:MAG: DegT/DnrJ/EryC1/StrS family aminotransferase [Candidatus Rokubacteria bacterium]|nr:DegT/DnrJ/EryC1/StrS family aminotransferase [Candidatus Rokubacteria bacterium]
MHHGRGARRGRSHHLRGPHRARPRRRRRPAAVLPRSLRPAARRDIVTIPLSRPPIDDEIKQAVLRAIDGRQYILGPECKGLEADLAAHTGTKHAVLVSSATAALWMIFKSLGVKPGDEILAPSHTAFPTIEAICFAGATPVFVDVDDWYTLDPKDAAAKVTTKTVGIVPVHLYGQPVDLPAVQDLATRHGLWLLEDCAQAQGATWNGKMVGSFGRAADFSFYPSKNLPAMGDGGAVLTNDDEIAARCRRLRDHGRLNKDLHAEVGFNLRFNELQAAALRVVLRRLDGMNDQRRTLAARYNAGLQDLPVVLPQEREHAHHVYHLYVIATPKRQELAAFLKERGIATGIHYPVPSHRQPAVEHFKPPTLPRTERLVEEILSLPMSPHHTEAEIDQVVAAVREFFTK